eukprot:363542-Chlamydomonas_euryale.AAC.2
MPNVHPAAAAVLNYWFGEDEVTGPKMSPCAPQQQTRWFRGSPGMDQVGVLQLACESATCVYQLTTLCMALGPPKGIPTRPALHYPTLPSMS